MVVRAEGARRRLALPPPAVVSTNAPVPELLPSVPRETDELRELRAVVLDARDALAVVVLLRRVVGRDVAVPRRALIRGILVGVRRGLAARRRRARPRRSGRSATRLRRRRRSARGPGGPAARPSARGRARRRRRRRGSGGRGLATAQRCHCWHCWLGACLACGAGRRHSFSSNIHLYVPSQKSVYICRVACTKN